MQCLVLVCYKTVIKQLLPAYFQLFNSMTLITVSLLSQIGSKIEVIDSKYWNTKYFQNPRHLNRQINSSFVKHKLSSFQHYYTMFHLPHSMIQNWSDSTLFSKTSYYHHKLMADKYKIQNCKMPQTLSILLHLTDVHISKHKANGACAFLDF